ncbi:MAG: hypothetical protein JXO51_02015, partial [Candidatus Aminicenantes bacterium]|nr:hypothetical protein [Candidatus Aminicenantes bacterium]
ELLARFAPERFGSAAAPEIKNIARAVCRSLGELRAEMEREPAPATTEAPEDDEFELSAEFAIDTEPLPAPEIIVDLEGPEIVPQAAFAEPEDIVEAEDQGLTPEPAYPEPPREFTPAAAPPSLRMADGDHQKAWDLLLQAKEMYERHEYAMAVPLLKKAIKLEPGQGDYYYLLGLCQGEAELTKNEAEMNLKKAIELKSWSADPVYALGVLYRGQGRMKLAERCFQRVKEIAYEHTGASRALVDLRRQRVGARGIHPSKRKKS